MKKVLKKLYDIFPFKRQVFTVLKTFWKPRESIYRHLNFKGVIKVPVDKSRSFKVMHYGYQVENEIFWAGITGGWEKESMKLWLKLCEMSEVIVDIGANTGVYSLTAKAINPKAKVFAFEPLKKIYLRLQGNIALNKFDIIPYEKAVSDKDGFAVVYPANEEHVYAVTVNKNLSSPEEKVFETTIETITLNSFIKENALQKIDLIKIDVETHEPEVLAGFSDYLVKYKPIMLIEILNDDIGGKVNHIVKDMGYLYFNIDEKGGIRLVEKITQSDFYNYLLCDPKTARTLGLVN